MPNWKAIGAGVGVLAAVGSAIGGGVAAYYAYKSAAYARLSADVAQQALQNNIVYQIQKDSIELARDYRDSKIGPGAIIAKMYSIYYQRQKGVIDDGLWPMLNYEYCVMMQRDKVVQSFWDIADKALYGQDFTDYVSGMRGGKKCA
jgi:hypothetical protein